MSVMDLPDITSGPAGARPPLSWSGGRRTDLRDPHLRVPDERARLRAGRGPARGRRLRPRARGRARPTWSCSTRARSGRTRPTGSTATSATCSRPRRRTQGMQIAVGGCLAQMEREQITKRAPWVDVVYGTHNIGSLPKLLERARERAARRRSSSRRPSTTFPSLLPARRESAVLRLGVDLRRLQQHLHLLHRPVAARERERDRRPGDILEEIRAAGRPRASSRSRCSART